MIQLFDKKYLAQKFALIDDHKNQHLSHISINIQ